MEAPKFPTIPKPEASLQSLQRSMQAVIDTLAVLTGPGAKSMSGDSTDRHMQHTFIQDTQPTALNNGDFWLSTHAFSVWNGQTWIKVGTIP